MLKIENNATANEVRWILSGRLVGPWVAELRSIWDLVRSRYSARRSVVDLTDVTLIDSRGEELLGDLRDEGAELVAKGLYTKHLLENLKSHRVPATNRVAKDVS